MVVVAMADAETTDDVDVRHRLTNDGLAYVLVVSNVALFAVAVAYGVDVPKLPWQTFALSVALAAVWAFGTGALRELLGALQGGGGEP